MTNRTTKIQYKFIHLFPKEECIYFAIFWPNSEKSNYDNIVNFSNISLKENRDISNKNKFMFDQHMFLFKY